MGDAVKTIKKTSVFPASKSVIFLELQKLETLQKIAFPYATFKPIDPNSSKVWQAGQTFEFRLKLFGFIPLGIHTIYIQNFDEINGLSTKEHSKVLLVWQHEIKLKVIDQNHTQYSDIVTFDAGLRTPFVSLWVSLFFAHRQRKWIKLLTNMKKPF